MIIWLQQTNKQTNKQINWTWCQYHAIILKWSSYVHLMIIWWSSQDHLMTIKKTSKKGLIIMSILSAVDYHVIMWWLCDNHPMIIIDQLLICYLQTNIQTYLNMMIMWSSWDWHKIIMSHSDLLMVIWISANDHLMIIW